MPPDAAMSARDSIRRVVDAINASVLGQESVVERLVIALLCNGNVLVEGLPGTAKTRSIKTLASVLEARLGRIQFTPDLLPSDVTGTEILFTDEGGRQDLRFREGPIFANLVLADEINRAPAKVQAALLEAMEERQVTVAGKTHPLPELFMVLATQNPIEQEGTYPLPEAQMDRFLMKVHVRYPDDVGELDIMRLVRGEDQARGGVAAERPAPVRVDQNAVLEARREVLGVHLAESVERYLVALVGATRRPGAITEELGGWIEVGASPRGTIGLDRASRAKAWMEGRDHVVPDDVRAVAPDVLRHRITLAYEAQADGVSPDDVLARLLEAVAIA